MALALPTVGAVACGPSVSVKTANLKSNPMPEGKEWRGVYYSQVYGNLHIVTEGDTVEGKWRTVAGEAWGELHGKADGDLFKYEWTEHKIGMVGPSGTRSGHGYFRYVPSKVSDIKDPDQIHGEWGLGESDAGNDWKAVKQPNVEPDPKSVQPDEVESGTPAVSGGGWDSGASKEEAPKAE